MVNPLPVPAERPSSLPAPQPSIGNSGPLNVLLGPDD
jgi:hypothetical protein